MEIELKRKAELKISSDDLQVYADPGLVKVLLTNLISNALKFSSNKEISRIELGETEMTGKRYLYIKDNGVGFDTAHSNKLFRAFSRLHSQREFPGTGIGLATVKRITSLHGGNIFAQSKLGEGATFHFTFNENSS